MFLPTGKMNKICPKCDNNGNSFIKQLARKQTKISKINRMNKIWEHKK